MAESEISAEVLFDRLRALSTDSEAPIEVRWAVAEILNLRNELATSKPETQSDDALPGGDSPAGGGNAGLVIPYDDLLLGLRALSQKVNFQRNRIPKASRKHHYYKGAHALSQDVLNSVVKNWGPASKYQKEKAGKG